MGVRRPSLYKPCGFIYQGTKRPTENIVDMPSTNRYTLNRHIGKSAFGQGHLEAVAPIADRDHIYMGMAIVNTGDHFAIL